ncbi:50S ribosomal protein L11 methyltransferase [Micromonospora sp. DR5-3]|uniref:class I SAM-dependent methyltransferase n=1 Tax=unclassified Micromonospora TaxID=2617518 RepID=UPI0011D932D6|nr:MULTISPECIES: 50S ribosomal protein L11 methyltransferase [unclassified Micromonospora]MCW3817856.1 50S ribosomal protein L11 methyltransferase [Micromonospora sp. DR5-3]TYC22977.1 methyltransferase [Micromonospora sp. MP36]
MPTPTGALLTPFVAFRADEFDGLHLARLPFVPEIRLYLADDAIVLRARLEARIGPGLTPFWANAWAGGQALARYVLDHPQVVAGRRVIDVACGSGLVAIAAAKAGAAEVTANDIDPYALAAVAMNATANAVSVAVNEGDLLDGDGGLADVILAGDAFYDPELTARMLGFLHRAADRGARVLVGDPGRGHLPQDWLKVMTSYQVRGLGAAEDAELTEVSVLGPAA